MDSLTQIVLGGSVSALVAPATHRRPALLAGGVLGTLPDLDVFWFMLAKSDAVTEVTWHRGPSHSLLLLTVLGGVLWLALRPRSRLIRAAPTRWLWAILLALLTHPLLDAFTVYGTQLLWPLPTPPIMWATIFIIDPLYTLPLLAGVIAAWRLAPGEASSQTSGGRRWLAAGLIISSVYLAWSVSAKVWVDRAASQSLSGSGLQQAPRFSTPLPFNTLLWRVVVMAPDGYWIGDRSLIADRGPMRFTFYPSDNQILAQLAPTPQLQRLIWFTHGFFSLRPQRGDDGETRLILADLRLGFEPDYFFRYDVAGVDAQGRWAVAPEIVRAPISADDRAAGLEWVWRRIFDSEAQRSTVSDERPKP